jgi:hypothetical protein
VAVDARRRVIAIVAVLAVLALVAGIASAGFTGSGSRSGSSRSKSTTSTTVPLNAAGRELLALLEKDKAATFHARYQATSAAQPDAAITIETWRKPPKVRQDSTVTSKGQSLKSLALVLGDGAVRCVQLSGAEWSCKSRPSEGDADDLLFGGVRDELAKGQVSVKDDVVDGRPVRCFTLAAEGRSSELCATAQGVPVRVVSGGSSLHLVGFDAAVSDEVFVPPAPPTPE